MEKLTKSQRRAKRNREAATETKAERAKRVRKQRGGWNGINPATRYAPTRKESVAKALRREDSQLHQQTR